MHPAHVIEQLDPEQRAVVEAPPGPVCVLAGAGTGKTRAITHRIAHAALTGRIQPQHVLAVTFTSRAAGEMRARLRALGVDRVQARTFHAAAWRQLAYFWPRVVGGELPTLLDNKFQVVGNAAARARLRIAPAEVRDLISEIEWAKARMLVPESYAAASAAAHREPPRAADEVAAVFREYEALKRRTGLVDFDDLLLLTAAAIEEHEDVADEIRARYRHFVVDEYQDVNPLQQRLLDGWLGGRDDLCVVGDDDQTIYSFTGASRDYLLRFRDRYPDATVVRLVRDYRSTPQVVALANAVIAGDPIRRAAPKRLIAQRPDGPLPQFREYDSEPDEAAAVAVRVRQLIDDGVPAPEIAILYRVNAQSAVYEQALSALDIPYVVRGGERFFDRREVREAMVALRSEVTRDDGSAALPELVLAALARVKWQPDAPPAGAGAARDRWEALAALHRLALDQPEGTAPAAFVAHLEERAADRHAPTVDGVVLASLHAAKGLEWDAVFIVGLVEGTVPIQYAETAEEIAEERRLLYVGVTRAREHLSLSWALSRQGGRRNRRRSSFLDGIVPAPAARAAIPRRLRPVLSAPADQELFDRLKAWRKQRADELGQPAYCVFTDATLTAIAEIRPGDVSELSRIVGVGPTKLDKFGADVLSLVADR